MLETIGPFWVQLMINSKCKFKAKKLEGEFNYQFQFACFNSCLIARVIIKFHNNNPMPIESCIRKTKLGILDAHNVEKIWV